MCSRVTCCAEIKLQFFLLKYISIRIIYKIPYWYNLFLNFFMTCVELMLEATLEKNLWPPVPRWSNGQWFFCLQENQEDVDSMASVFWGWHFKSSVCICWTVIANDATNVTIYKTLKWTELTMLKMYRWQVKHLSGLTLSGGSEGLCTSSRLEVFYKKGVLRDFANFTGKH